MYVDALYKQGFCQVKSQKRGWLEYQFFCGFSDHIKVVSDRMRGLSPPCFVFLARTLISVQCCVYVWVPESAIVVVYTWKEFACLLGQALSKLRTLIP